MPPARNPVLPALLTLILLAIPTAPAVAENADETTAERAEQAREDLDIKRTSAREIIESEKRTEALMRERQAGIHSEASDGQTPFATALALRTALENEDYETAAEYIDMRYVDEEVTQISPGALVRALVYMLRQQTLVDVSSLSDDPEGWQDDGLPSYRDLLATIEISSGPVPIYLQRVPDGADGRMWKISNATVARIPEMWAELGFHPAAEYLFNILPDFTFMGLLNWQVLGITLAIVAAWLAATAFTWAANKLAQLIPNRFPLGIERFFRRPLRIFLFIIIAMRLTEQLGLSLKARVLLHSSGVDYLAYTILLLGIISLVRDYNIRRLQALGQHNFAALLRPMTSMVKVIVVVIIALIWADNAGYDMTTILAGLGVGSVAVALAAQKTLENLIGAITLYAARPVSPGDFCRFGTIKGTVEEIGLRSTTVRTLDRTLVHIPNSVFSSAEIENYSARDRIRFFRTVNVLASSPDQVRVILAKLRETLYSHAMVNPDTVSVRLEEVGESASRLRIDAGVRTTDYQQYLAVAEDINLRFIQIVQDAGAGLAGPGQLRIIRDDLSDRENNQYIKEILALWREQDKQPFPDFSDDEISAMQGTIDYPTSR